ncbi:hypothetical protein HOLleu_05712 [Holothuria leucospilota]|uniref:Uncharacterized protein n=1 Tax=Holothuria leucospilota TaxID=206669 RepID=A0A9Q1CK89_HOLLE|nr:hypothetical protein HOLleu_05712 [Holothuria leucospilota]
MLLQRDELFAILATMLHTFFHIVPVTVSKAVTHIPLPPASASSFARENCLPSLNEGLIQVNLTRTVNGDEFTRYCGLNCDQLCHSAGAVRLLCDIKEIPQCRCKCLNNETILSDSSTCKASLQGCQPPILHIHVPPIGDDSSSNTSSSRIDEREETQGDLSKRPTPLECRLLGVHSAGTDGRELFNISQSFNVTRIDEKRIEVTLTKVTHELRRLQGQLLKLNVNCQASLFCIAVKLSGSIKHSINFHSPHLPSAMTYDDDITTQEIGTMTPAAKGSFFSG